MDQVRSSLRFKRRYPAGCSNHFSPCDHSIRPDCAARSDASTHHAGNGLVSGTMAGVAMGR